MTSAEERAAVVEETKTWLCTPYHHMARVKGAGVDCAMLLAEVYHAALPDRIPVIDPGFYPPDWGKHRDVEKYLAWLEPYATPTYRARPGDAVLIKVGRVFSHAAIVVEWPQIIHAVMESNVQYGDAEKDQGLFREKSGKLRDRRFYTLWDD